MGGVRWPWDARGGGEEAMNRSRTSSGGEKITSRRNTTSPLFGDSPHDSPTVTDRRPSAAEVDAFMPCGSDVFDNFPMPAAGADMDASMSGTWSSSYDDSSSEMGDEDSMNSSDGGGGDVDGDAVGGDVEERGGDGVSNTNAEFVRDETTAPEIGAIDGPNAQL